MLRDHWDRYTPILTPIGIDLMPMLTNDIFSGTHANPMRCIFGARCPILLRLYCNTGKTNENEIYWLLMRRRAKRVACNLPNFFPLHLGIMFFFFVMRKIFMYVSPSFLLSPSLPHLSPSLSLSLYFLWLFPAISFPLSKVNELFSKAFPYSGILWRFFWCRTHLRFFGVLKFLCLFLSPSSKTKCWIVQDMIEH